VTHDLNFPDVVPELVGELARLRELSDADIPAWYERATDVEAADLAGDPVPESIEAGQQWLNKHRDRFQQKVALRWAIVPKERSASIGTVGLSFRGGETRRAELSVVVARAFWGRGIGTSAAELVLHYAFSKLGVAEVFAEVLPRNAGSIRLLEKTGFALSRVIAATESEPEGLLQYVLPRRHGAA
jgi:[ribosomal protein S5]-alanine N-acetyltransferase